MQYTGYNQNYQQSQHQATQRVYQPPQNSRFDQSGNVTPKQGFVYSNQVHPTQSQQSNVIVDSQVQSGQQNYHTLQQNSYLPLNTTTQQQTNSIAQQSPLSYNYQPTSGNFNVQQNHAMNSNPLNLPFQPFQTPSSQSTSSLPQASTRHASNNHQCTDSYNNSL